MTVFRYFIKLAFRNKWIMLGYIGLFFLISVLNSSGTTGEEVSFIESRLTIGIIDNSDTELLNSLKDYLESKNNIIETEDDEEYIKEQIFVEMADAVIIIPEDFDERVINEEEAILVYKDHRKAESIQIENQINKFLT